MLRISEIRATLGNSARSTTASNSIAPAAPKKMKESRGRRKVGRDRWPVKCPMARKEMPLAQRTGFFDGPPPPPLTLHLTERVVIDRFNFIAPSVRSSTISIPLPRITAAFAAMTKTLRSLRRRRRRPGWSPSTQKLSNHPSEKKQKRRVR